jgi:hypothetical protein
VICDERSPESLITQLSPTIVLYAFRVRLLAERGVTLQAFEVGIDGIHRYFCAGVAISFWYEAARVPLLLAIGSRVG